MKTLIIAEHDNRNLNEASLTVATAALKFNSKYDILVVGYNSSLVAKEASKLKGCEKVYVVDAKEYENQLPENLSLLLKDFSNSYKNILISHSVFGKNLLPRVAALLDIMPISDVIEILSNKTFIRPMYAGNIRATIESHDQIKLLSIRPSSFTAIEKQKPVEIISLNTIYENNVSRFICLDSPTYNRPDLSNAKIVVSCGRGLKGVDSFKLIEEFADLMGAAIGGTRAAVDAGYIPNEFQVGQTGKIIAPDLYFAIGISGAVQHLAGMKESKTIVAINSDPEAPIFGVSDFGLVGDLFDILPKLINVIKQQK